MNPGSAVSSGKDERVPPRARLLAVAGELFYRHGIRAVGVEAIAEAAGTNKMTLYRHFASKDELVVACLRQAAELADACWDRFAQVHPGNALAQLRAWLREMADHVANTDERGCALANAAVELPEKDHPARRVIGGLELPKLKTLWKGDRRFNSEMVCGSVARYSFQKRLDFRCQQSVSVAMLTRASLADPRPAGETATVGLRW